MTNQAINIYKGMRRVRYSRPDTLLTDARQSPYFWWWAYLRMSKDYWWVCQRNGVADDKRLRDMYWDFRDVYQQPFDAWWADHGAELFREQRALPVVRQLDPQDLRFTPKVEQHLLLEIPLGMTERTIIRQVRELLRKHPDREVKRVSSANRPLAKLVGIRSDVIEIAQQVWQCHYEALDASRLDRNGKPICTKSLYQIGKELRLVKSCMPVVTDTKELAAKRVNGMKVAVSRMLTRANNFIENAAVGTFPSIQTPKEPIVWRPVQQQKLDAAVAAGQWHPLFDPNDTLTV